MDEVIRLTLHVSHRYFQSSNGSVGNSSQTTAISKIFDRYRGIVRPARGGPRYLIPSHVDSPIHNPDTIEVEGSMRYFADLQVNLDDVVALAIAEALSAPTLGEFTREGFVQGWKSLR